MSSSAAAPTVGPHAPLDDIVEIELDRATLSDSRRPLLLRTCPRCASAPATRLERLRLRALPSWLLVSAVALYTLAVAFATRATDFVWYHSLLPRPLYEGLLQYALVATLLVPPLFGLVALTVRLTRPRLSLKVSTCATCDRRLSRTTLGRVLSVALLGIAWGVTALVAKAVGASIDLALALYVPVTAIGISWFSHLTDRDRVRFVRQTARGAVLRAPRVFARVLADERPALVRSVAAIRPRSLALVGLIALSGGLLTLLAVDEGALVCPVGARGHVSFSQEDGSEHHWCALPSGVPHGRYHELDDRGDLLRVGGFDHGVPSGTWGSLLPEGGVSFTDARHVVRPWEITDDLPRAAFAPPSP